MNWNDQDIALLAKLRAAGLSTRQIDHRLHYSNGAICGKINRLGLKRGYVPAAKPVIVAPVPVPHPSHASGWILPSPSFVRCWRKRRATQSDRKENGPPLIASRVFLISFPRFVLRIRPATISSVRCV
jgi:hypothetical protein